MTAIEIVELAGVAATLSALGYVIAARKRRMRTTALTITLLVLLVTAALHHLGAVTGHHAPGSLDFVANFSHGLLPVIWGFFILTAVIESAVTSARESESQLRRVLTNIPGGVSAATGREFFRSLVRHLAEALGADHVFVGEVIAGRANRVRTVAVFSAGRIAENFEYDLDGTPCENVVTQRLCSYRKGVQESYPRDGLLAAMGVEAYVGAPLIDSRGEALGLMAVMFMRPVRETALAESLLRVFAVRASAEL